MNDADDDDDADDVDEGTYRRLGFIHIHHCGVFSPRILSLFSCFWYFKSKFVLLMIKPQFQK